MKFSEILTEAKAWLQQEGRLTYRSLMREYALDDETLEDLKEELIYSNQQIRDDEGRGLIWNGEGGNLPNSSLVSSPSQSPAAYTPQHL